MLRCCPDQAWDKSVVIGLIGSLVRPRHHSCPRLPALRCQVPYNGRPCVALLLNTVCISLCKCKCSLCNGTASKSCHVAFCHATDALLPHEPCGRSSAWHSTGLLQACLFWVEVVLLLEGLFACIKLPCSGCHADSNWGLAGGHGGRGVAGQATRGVGPDAPAHHIAQCLPVGLPFAHALCLCPVWQAAQRAEAEQPFSF